MKKPFNATKIGKILTSPVVKTALGLVPFGLGSAANELLSVQPKQPEGQLQSDRWVFHVLKIAIYAGILYLVFTGKLSMEDAEAAKDFINTP